MLMQLMGVNKWSRNNLIWLHNASENCKNMQVRYNFDRKWLAARVYVSLDGLKKSWTMVSTTALEKKKKKNKLNLMEKIQVLNILRFHYQFLLELG